jgi:hypothetical protein
MPSKQLCQPNSIWMLTNSAKLERFLDVLFATVLPQKRVTTLVPSEKLLKIFRRKLTMEQN